jgi:ABC-type amino acid transport substrate-binding protein
MCIHPDKPGYATELVKTVFEGSNYSVSIEIFPWSRSIKMVRAGEAQALLAPAKSEAPDLLYPSEELGVQKMCIWTRPDSLWEYKGLDSLKGLQIGSAYDVSIEILNKYIKAHEEQFQLMPFNDAYIKKSLKKLEYHRIDAFVLTHNFAMFELNALKARHKVRLAGCLSNEKFYLAFSPNKHAKLSVEKIMTFFDKRIREIRKSGQLDSILQTYGLKDWK